MYYEKRKNNYLGIIVIIMFLVIIIAILLSLVNKVDSSYQADLGETTETGTEAVKNEFSVENLMKNSIYSVVRNFKIKWAKYSNFCRKFRRKIGDREWNNS